MMSDGTTPTPSPEPLRPPPEHLADRFHWLYNPSERRVAVAEWGRGSGTSRQRMWRLGYHRHSQTRMAELGWHYGSVAVPPPYDLMRAVGARLEDLTEETRREVEADMADRGLAA